MGRLFESVVGSTAVALIGSVTSNRKRFHPNSRHSKSQRAPVALREPKGNSPQSSCPNHKFTMRKNFDLSAMRQQLAEQQGKSYWRSLDELAATPEFQDLLRHEFPQHADQWHDTLNRRTFLKLMGASLALGGLTACRSAPPEKVVPYVRAPEEVVPGEPLFFATATQLGGVATGVLAESHLGRPTKIEGNPDHPGSLGATDLFTQAEVLSLYDPDRAQSVTQAGLVNTWTNLLTTIAVAMEQQQASDGAGLRILTETVTSPAMAAQLRTLLAEYPAAHWHQYEPINRDHERLAALRVFGEDVHLVYQVEKADTILALDADFMAAGPIGVRYARDFSTRRTVRVADGDAADATMNRLYVAETTPTVTGSIADHRLPLRPSEMEQLVQALAAALGVAGSEAPPPATVPADWIEAVAADLRENAGRSLVMAGRTLSPTAHALVFAINEVLGNVDETLYYTAPLAAEPVTQVESLRELTDAMAAGEVELLFIIDANPVYDAPADFEFGQHLRNVDLRIRMGLYEDETSALCQWHVPSLHSLEAWRDARAYDGSVTLTQPLIEPLYDDRSPYQLFAALLGQPGLLDHDVVRSYWQAALADDEEDGEDDDEDGGAFEQFWRETLFVGVMAESALPAKAVNVDRAAVQTLVDDAVATDRPTAATLELALRPDPTIWDGRFANNGWLQELPKPITKLTWDNAALISPATAEQLGLAPESVVVIELADRAVRAPVWVLPGQADGAVTLHLGYGRQRAGRVGTDIGVDAYRLRTATAFWAGAGVALRTTDATYPLATTQSHYRMEDRHLVRGGTLDLFHAEPDFPHHVVHEPPDISLFDAWDYPENAWGMAVDLNTCNGCNACVIACQAENNIPVVGKEQVLVGREMHWMRIDTYFEGELDDPDVVHQPVMCQHCEQAPCELVCPVHATVHDSEGLNVMVYNRCIGTRYCSNNCPYKVRRFNFLEYHEPDGVETLEMQHNPDVTVRVRGVMEKCTYCIQRISAARIHAKKENRPIRDGEVQTACQSACPMQAITFGNINDPDARVAAAKAEPHNYGILTHLGTRPRTSYLAKLRNPNPLLVTETDEVHHE